MRSHNIELLIFDFDGTLFDTSLDIANAINYALRTLGKKELDPHVIWDYTGDGLLNTVKRSLGEEDNELISKAFEITLRFYEEHSGEFSKPIDEVISFLKRDTRNKVILSNKNLAPMIKVLEKFKIRHLFSHIYGFDSLPFFKPDPRTVDLVLQITKIPKERVALVGDADQDVLTAKNANIKCFLIPSKKITVDYNYLIFRDYNELEILLEKT